MATSKFTSGSKTQGQLEDEYQQLLLSLPNDIGFGVPLYFYKGFWCSAMLLKGVMKFQNNFQAYDTDIFLASLPKTGTTWLKALLFVILNRKNIPKDFSQHPFHTKTPHELILHLEINLYSTITENPELSEIPSPRVLGTHVPYLSLPDSIKTTNCRIVYICRNPLDTFVSSWYFFPSFDRATKPSMEMMEECLNKFSEGVSPFGPYEDHLLGYWKESLQNPQKVLFLEYEGLKKDPKANLKKLAEFVNCPFTEEEENGSVIDEIIELCSLKSMKNMEVNKNESSFSTFFENKAWFRKGEVGDWSNHLTPSMAKRVDDMQEKLKKANFAFTYYQANPKT